jgi:hypothetical protein
MLSTEYRMVYKVEELPLAVQIELKDYPMADADGAYQVGCVTSGPEPKPLSRLIFGAIAHASKEKNVQEQVVQEKYSQQNIDKENNDKQLDCYVHFESGGFAHTYSGRHYTMTSLTANKANLVEGTYVPERCATVDELKGLLASVQ